jgi:hypothetical protein
MNPAEPGVGLSATGQKGVRDRLRKRFRSRDRLIGRVSFKMAQAGVAGPLTQDTITISPGPRFRAAMVLAVVADALQLIVFPLFVEGALSPADDALDFGVGAMMVHLLGWHWEFLPSFLAKLVPGVDLVPFWTLAVANVYRKSKQIAVNAEEIPPPPPALKDSQ